MTNLLARISLPWSFTRVLYLLVGGIIVGQAIMDQLWFGIIFGGYFMAMGIFSWGCAAGNCAIPREESNKKD